MPFQVGDVVRRRDVNHIEGVGSNHRSLFPQHYALGGLGIVTSVLLDGVYIQLSPPADLRTSVERWEKVTITKDKKKSRGLSAFNKKHGL